jgi:hypothetical protein
MANEFDPYREALVMEIDTIWPDELAAWTPARRQQLERILHSDPKSATNLEYIRTHTGFRRQITVSAEDSARLN